LGPASGEQEIQKHKQKISELLVLLGSLVRRPRKARPDARPGQADTLLPSPFSF
jgi:hypothetical protein